MICDECKKEGLRSIVHIDYSAITAMFVPSYYDEDGKYHFHDLNGTTTMYHCSKGHVFAKTRYPVWTCCQSEIL